MVNRAESKHVILSDTNHTVRNKVLVDGLDIFPVSDGDTGTNMSMTISAAARELEKSNGAPGINAVTHTVASAMLRGARGSSGVILSLLFRDFSKGPEGLGQATDADLRKTLGLDVDIAYKAVMKPIKGTILAVSCVTFEKGQAAAKLDDDAVSVWSTICKGIDEALETAPELLSVSKKASATSAGGEGLCLIFEGMPSILQGGVILDNEQSASGTGIGAASVQSTAEELHHNVAAGFGQEITFIYCIESIVSHDPEIETDPQTDLRPFLEGAGDCVVVVDDEEIIRVHVHIENPDNALQGVLEYDQLLAAKVENVKEQHRIAAEGNQATPVPVAERPAAPEVAEPEEEIGFAAVAAGDGLRSLFMNLGCPRVVSGGRTMDPSTRDIMVAMLVTPAKMVMMLSNNKNVVMAAEQTVPLIKDRRVVALPIRAVPRGLSAMLACDPEASVERSTAITMETTGPVATGQVTFAARDFEFDGHRIKEGDILGLRNGKLNMIGKDPVHTVAKLTRSTISCTASFVTLICGKDITESQAQDTYSCIKSRISGDVEVTLAGGGQSVHYFIVSVE